MLHSRYYALRYLILEQPNKSDITIFLDKATRLQEVKSFSQCHWAQWMLISMSSSLAPTESGSRVLRSVSSKAYGPMTVGRRALSRGGPQLSHSREKCGAPFHFKFHRWSPQIEPAFLQLGLQGRRWVPMCHAHGNSEDETEVRAHKGKYSWLL